MPSSCHLSSCCYNMYLHRLRQHCQSLRSHRSSCSTTIVITVVESIIAATILVCVITYSLCLFTYISTSADMDAEKIELVGDNSYGSFVQEESSIDNINNKIYIYWIFLAGAIIFEVMGTTMMKLSEGLTQILPSIAIFLFYGCSFILMPLSLKRIELSTAYAIWSGVGTTLTSLIGVVHFGDTINPVKIVAIVFVVVGCAMLQVADSI
ncbi:multidrug efflux SMR transporter [Skeletonema marinoi]|uniref:Multidrug efflux SMR transporter n=1 Tax=Skeletonema marinoi TaxID=267567 RepID=A0AAD9D7P1_9STRA|nr:multidrug efflux SMR transporter [Skeletonema marinoi]